MTNSYLRRVYRPAVKALAIIELADNRICALDGPTAGEQAWNHLHPYERLQLKQTLSQLKKALA